MALSHASPVPPQGSGLDTSTIQTVRQLALPRQLTQRLLTQRLLTQCLLTQPQRRVAELLMELAREGPAQVLCVSHNAAFQAACDGSLRVAGPVGGSRPADGGGAGAPVAATAKAGGKQRAGAAAGGGKSKRARVHFSVA